MRLPWARAGTKGTPRQGAAAEAAHASGPSPSSRLGAPRTGRRRWRPAYRLVSVVAVAAALCCLVGLGWAGIGTRSELHEAVQRALRVTELRGTIAHLDELLTMSARMAALSGDTRWATRYDAAEPRLDAAINEAVALATPQVAAELARTTDAANRRLVELERASLARVVAGDRAEAWALLDSQEYDGLKTIYASGIESFGQELESYAAAHTANLNHRAWLETSGLVLGGGVFLIAAALAMRGHARLRVALDYTESVARHDSLTGLSNRFKFREHMEQALLGVRRGGSVAVLYLDLDGFKGVNDTFGHPVGDELLCAVADRLRGCTRETDLVARLGGDEFAIVQVGARQPEDATTLSDRLVRMLQQPFDVGGHRAVIGASVGIAVADAAVTADGLLRNADIALYRAKTAGRGTGRVVEPEMDAEMQARRTLEADLRRAVAEEQFELFYQPLVSASTERLTGFEALLRWQHPERGVVSPSEFIPLAEEIGLIRTMGAWVLERACIDAAGWPAHIKVAINLSPVQFLKGDLVQDVEHALVRSGLAASRLELEITESVLLQDSDATLAVLLQLRDLGVRISMDDFGTGYSSLSYLLQFPFDKIKIDQSFVRNSGARKGSVEIIRAVVGLGQALSMNVLAEGVETPEQLRMLQTEGCDELQGYLFSKPKPLQDVAEIIAAFSLTEGEEGRAAAQPAEAPRPTLVGSRP